MAECQYTQAEARETVHEMAAREFVEHRLTGEGPRLWRCAKPGTGIYSFRVALLPGCVVVAGDVGDAMLRTGHGKVADTIWWLRGANWDYLLGKVLHRKAHEDFYAGDVFAYLREREREAGSGADRRPWSELLADAERMHQFGDLNAQSWAQLAYDQTGDAELSALGTGWHAQAFWTVECLALFVRLYDTQCVMDPDNSAARCRTHDGEVPEWDGRNWICPVSNAPVRDAPVAEGA